MKDVKRQQLSPSNLPYPANNMKIGHSFYIILTRNHPWSRKLVYDLRWLMKVISTIAGFIKANNLQNILPEKL